MNHVTHVDMAHNVSITLDLFVSQIVLIYALVMWVCGKMIV